MMRHNSTRKKKAFLRLALFALVFLLTILAGDLRPLPTMVIRDMERHYALPRTEILHHSPYEDGRHVYLSHCEGGLLCTTVKRSFPTLWASAGYQQPLTIAAERCSAGVVYDWGSDSLIFYGFVPDGMEAPTFVIQQLYHSPRRATDFTFTPETTIPLDGGKCFFAFVPITYLDRENFNSAHFLLLEGDPSLMEGIYSMDHYWEHWSDD